MLLQIALNSGGAGGAGGGDKESIPMNGRKYSYSRAEG